MGNSESLDYFGRLVTKDLRDRAIEEFEILASGLAKAPGLAALQADIGKLPSEQVDLIRRCLVTAVDSGIHDFLFKLHEQADLSGRLQLMVDDEDVFKLSDGLQGEPVGEDGWFARFSAYNDTPKGD